MPDFDTQEWISFWSVVVASLALLSNVVIAVLGNARTNRKLSELEKSMASGIEKLDGKVNDLDGTTRYLTGYLEGWRRAAAEEERRP